MASVTFPSGIGGSGATFSDDSNPSTGLANGGAVSRLVPLLQNVVAVGNYIASMAPQFAGTFALFQDQKAYNVAGGTSSTGLNQRTSLNTTVANNIVGCSMSAGVVTLANAGTYEFHVKATAQTPAGHVMNVVVRTTSGGALVLSVTGPTEYTNNQSSVAMCCGRVTITQSSYFQLLHYVNTGVATNGLGNPHGISGANNVYVELEIKKVA